MAKSNLPPQPPKGDRREPSVLTVRPTGTENLRPAGKPTPDTLAVAVAADPASAKAPVVLASGRGFIAEQILQIAFETGVKVREDADLAQLLAAVDVDTEIPLEAFTAVAEILAYVYRANAGAPAPAEKPQGAEHRAPEPGPTQEDEAHGTEHD